MIDYHVAKLELLLIMTDHRRLNYTLLDVFCLPSKPFTGNQLAVVHGSVGLETSQLQTIASEFNLSETAFPLPPPDDADYDYHTRIFTIIQELPFAGHPSLGSAWSMRDVSVIPPSKASAVQSCKYGRISISFDSSNPDRVFLSSPPSFVNTIPPPSDLLSALSLSPEQVNVVSVHAASCGLPFIYVRAERKESVQKAKPSLSQIVDVAEEVGRGVLGIVFFWVEESINTEPDTDVKVHQRVFTVDVLEDPATGSASLGLGLVLLHSKILSPTGTSTYSISQGTEMGRPSAIRGRVVAENHEAKECWVGGDIVKVGEGWIRVPEYQ